MKNWNFLVPIVLFVVSQSLIAVWWAAGVQTTMTTVQKELSTTIELNHEENAKQWERINANTSDVADVMTELARGNAILELTRDDIQEIKTDIRATNDLIRDLLTQTRQ